MGCVRRPIVWGSQLASSRETKDGRVGGIASHPTDSGRLGTVTGAGVRRPHPSASTAGHGVR